MTGTHVCGTFFFRATPETLAERYEAAADPANGYLTRLNGSSLLVDAQATETADWSRQTRLAAAMTDEDEAALSVFIVGESWALALAQGGAPGPVAVYTVGDPDVLDTLPFSLRALEEGLTAQFPRSIHPDAVDYLFGALLEGVIPAEEVVSAILQMLGCAPDWLRWGWYETIPEQLLLDPDLAERVTPLGDARDLWEE